MQLTRYSDYSLRVLIFLAVQREGLATTEQIAKAYGISLAHLSKVVKHLARRGYVETVRGRSGGLRLAVPPEEIVLGEVVRSTEETLALVECFSAPGSGACRIESACDLARVLDQALRAFLAVLDGHTLADVVRRRTALRQLLAIAR
jgi:Rrf2 family nitric oxide-sensitive transcriptional repressor